MSATSWSVSPTSDHTFFFTEPSVPSDEHDRPGGVRSVLYAVRHDIASCLLDEQTFREDEVLRQWQDYRRLLPATLLIVAGIDLLSKFAAGSDNPTAAGERFCRFLRKYMAYSVDESEVCYSVRRALMQSFGMYDSETRRRVELEAMCGDIANSASPVTVQPGSSGEALVVCVRHLYGAFLAATARYAGDVEFDILDRKAFDRMFKHYGCIHTGATRGG